MYTNLYFTEDMHQDGAEICSVARSPEEVAKSPREITQPLG